MNLYHMYSHRRVNVGRELSFSIATFFSNGKQVMNTTVFRINKTSKTEKMCQTLSIIISLLGFVS